MREHWEFIPENRLWDGDARELISLGTGLHQLSPDAWAEGMSDRWWKCFAKAFVVSQSLNHALSQCCGMDGDDVA